MNYMEIITPRASIRDPETVHQHRAQCARGSVTTSKDLIERLSQEREVNIGAGACNSTSLRVSKGTLASLMISVRLQTTWQITMASI